MDRAEMLRLAERVESATDWHRGVMPELVDEFCRAIGIGKQDSRARIRLVSAMQGDLNAVLALVAEKLPERAWSVWRVWANERWFYNANLRDLDAVDWDNDTVGSAPTPALALLAAFLRAYALAHQEPDHAE